MIGGKLLSWVRRYETYYSHPYLNSKGFVTVGYGRNVDEQGFSVGEADIMLENDLKRSRFDLSRMPWFIEQPRHVQDALVHLCFMVGIEKILSMEELIKCIKDQNYPCASKQILNMDVGPELQQRMKDISLMISEGE